MSRYLAIVVIGIGLGLGIGAATDGAADAYAWVFLLVGLALLLLRPGRRPTSLVTPDGDAPVGARRGSDPRPTLAGLGTRVEQVLRLAEEQAENHRAGARQEAEQILRAARLEADGIRQEGGSAEGHR